MFPFLRNRQKIGRTNTKWKRANKRRINTLSLTLEITNWLIWFLECMNRAILNSNSLLERIMIKARFWKTFAQTLLNNRQTKVINRLLDAGPNGFEGGLKNKQYMGITHTSRATAQRELADLVQKKVLVRLPGGGRSASYDLNWSKLGG